MSEPVDIPGAVAIIGMAGRFPGAKNVDEFWRNLCAGTESISRFTDAELEDAFSAEIRSAPNFVKARPILEGVELFDAEFFGMNPKEAELTDPQHRLFLECAWEAIESAGYDPAAYPGAIGVFGGASINTYFLNHVLSKRSTIEQFASDYQVGSYAMLLGAGQDFLATRVSYKLNLTGPSITMGTACSTSLLAVAQACQSLLLYQADMALAGGVSISFPQKRGYQHLEGGMVSADGHCRPFDADATGTVFGSGAGAVLLKRLEDAIADGDHIYAIVRGAGINNDGAAKVGFTAPSVDGQATVIRMAHANADVDPRSISYIECHGTATPLGDPIEIAGLTKAFAAATPDLGFCAIGSVKGNVGHLDAAAGVTGLIKTALALHYKILPASLHFQRANPQIDFSKTAFFVNARLTPWAQGRGPRRAGVSAFGVGGTNVHVILEESPVAAHDTGTVSGNPQLLLLSARSPGALDRGRKQLAAHLQDRTPNLADVAFTLRSGRRAFEQRFCTVARDLKDASAKLSGTETNSTYSGRCIDNPNIVFMFPGQGAQYAGMGRDLYERGGIFRESIERCAAILAARGDTDLIGLLYPAEYSAEAQQRLMSTVAAQPAIFSVEYALAQLWMSWGIKPAAMIGHSVGEFVAAVIAGVFSLEDALTIVAARGQLMQNLPGGAMLSVRLPEVEARALLTEPLSIAAVNAPFLCVVAGPYEAVDAYEKLLAQKNIVSRRLHTSHAFHSAMVEPMVEPLRQTVAQLAALTPLRAPSIPYVSCVTGTWILPEQAMAPDYWAKHAREAVRFADGVAVVASSVSTLLIEVGPGNALSTLAAQTQRDRKTPVIASMQDAARERNDSECLLDALGRLWVNGCTLDWQAIESANGASDSRRVPLPTYSFDRARHWIDAPQTLAAAPVAPPLTLTQDISAMNQSPADSRISQVSSMIAAILEDLSGNKPDMSDAQTTFLELGFDSLLLTTVAQKIQSQMKVKIAFRQLLGDYSTAPALTAFLADKATLPAAPAASRVPASYVAAAAPMLQPTAGLPASGGLEGLFRDQLQVLNATLAKQFEILQQLGVSNGAAPAIVQSALPMSAPAIAPPAIEAPASGLSTELDQSKPSRYDIFTQKKKPADTSITSEQRDHVDALIKTYVAKTLGSKHFTQDNRVELADPRAAAGFRSEWKEMVYPIVCKSSHGSKIIDIDDNEYIDLVNGYGQTAFGHAPQFVTDAVKAQLDVGFAIGPQADMAGKVAKLFCEMTGNERMTYCNTGSEAVMAAMRIARTVTGREKIVIFNGDYHGQFDEVLVKGVQRGTQNPRSKPVAPGIPGSQVENMIVLEYGSDQALNWIRANADDLAAVIFEPVQSRHPHLRPFEFLREIRKITEVSGTAFILDEVVTGFRVHTGGIQAVAGIRADLATYGKVVGGGLPVGILAGNARFMDALDGGQWRFGDESIPEVGVTFFAGTFVRHPLVLAAMWAVLNYLKEQGPALQETLARKTLGLVERLNVLFASRGIVTKIESYSSWFFFQFHGEHPLATLLFYHLRERGIHIQDGFPCFLTTAHSDSDFDRIYSAFEESIDALQSVGILGQPQKVGSALAAPVSASQGIAPLTENQFEIWLAAQMSDEASCAFNESITLRLDGTLHDGALREALDTIAARHDALRAHFNHSGEQMRIAAAAAFPLAYSDFSADGPTGAEERYAALLAADARTAFDLVAGPCARAHLVKLTPERHALLFTAHHIICDGWSINVLVNEIAALYAARLTGTSADLPQPTQFSDYARAEKRRNAAELAKTEQFWLKQFAVPPTLLEVPTDRPRPEIKSFNGASVCRRIDQKLYQATKKAGAKQGSTLFVTLLAAFEVLMGRLADQSDVVVGVPTAGQSLLEDETLVGHCVNFLPIHGDWSQSTRVSEHLASTAKRVLAAYEHQNYTFGTLVQKLNFPREAGRLPLTEIQFNLERLADQLELPNLRVTVEPNAKAFVNFDLFLNVIESPAGLRMDCDYNTDLFDEATVVHWLECYQALLENIVADANRSVTAIPYMPAAEFKRLTQDVNATAVSFARDRTVNQLFEAQAAATPTAQAVQFGESILTYEALNRRANQLANVLLQKLQTSANSERLVGVSMERSLEMLIALIAVHKAGCAYVPLDPSHPPARLRHILGEAEVVALISDGSESEALVANHVPIIDVRKAEADIARAPDSQPAVRADAEKLAYVIYTSGSTGQPKGVEIPHRAVVNLLQSMARQPGLSAKDVFVALTTISFDIAALELFLPLCVGAKTVIADREDILDGHKLLQRIDALSATAMQATPSGWRMLLEAGFSARTGFKMLCGGELLPRDLADRLLASRAELWNMYGPTETTIWSSCARITADSGPIAIGGPIANTQFYVLDQHDQPVPAGVSGQLHIGGDGVARGYYKRAELTAEKFVVNPFAPGRMYRTGDLAKWQSDGSLHIAGRIDNQVKVRGFRIELGEIESILRKKAGLADAAVILRSDIPGSPRIVAYYVENSDQVRSVEWLQTCLADDLPDYMVPSVWMKLAMMPLSPNGKLDRKALPIPDASHAVDENYVEASNATEKTLTSIFAEVLGVERIGTTSNLLRLGADSIQLFQITARANRAGLIISTKLLLQHKTAGALAAAIDAGGRQPASADKYPSLKDFSRTRRA